MMEGKRKREVCLEVWKKGDGIVLIGRRRCLQGKNEGRKNTDELLYVERKRLRQGWQVLDCLPKVRK